MRFTALALLVLSSTPAFAAAGTRGTAEAFVVTPAKMTDRGHVEGQQPTQVVVEKNPDGSITVRADF